MRRPKARAQCPTVSERRERSSHAEERSCIAHARTRTPSEAQVTRAARLPFDSEGARALNRDIFETIYFAALDASCELA
eukprot:scaffold49917_cov41-Tisochrysis_lutea.AAC.2